MSPFVSNNVEPKAEPTMPAESTGPEPIAIVGMGCRWPGSVNDLPSLWELLKNKRSGYRKFGDHRFHLDGFHHPNPDRPGTIATEGGFLLAEDPRLFDHAFFGMTSLEVETMDPSQRKLLEVVYEAFENAGVRWDEFSGSRTGVYVGNFSNDHVLMQGRDPDHPRPYASTGSSISILSNRVNYIFNLHGPSVTIDTACSSSMYALHMAVSAIRNGDCDSAIVAASNTIMDPATQLMMTKLGVLSPTSTCHTFDSAADGYARGEGFAALYLKKVTDAAAGNFPIRAVVRGTAINANGRTGGITHPSKQGQEAVIRQAYHNAGDLPLEDTTYFECHGTGTPVGDPIEISAIGNVFSACHSGSEDDPLLVGSVKTNLGHTESGSAIAGIMKVVLALETGLIPPSIGIQKLNPKVDFATAKVRVLTEVTPWPQGKLKRASINSFGYGGANGHCIIDHVDNVLPGYQNNNNNNNNNRQYRLLLGGSEVEEEEEEAPLPRWKPQMVQSSTATTRSKVLLPFSAHNEASLKLNIEVLKDVIDQHSLADVAYTLAAKRSRFLQRAVCLVDRENPTASLANPDCITKFTSGAAAAAAAVPRLGFVFTGQGAQWHGMGAELFQYRVFKDSIQFLDLVIESLSSQQLPEWTVEEVLKGDIEKDRINTPEISQTVCTALQIGIVDLLKSWNVQPTAVVGHSSGEIAAAYASGRLTKAEAIISAYFRGQAVSQNKQFGYMLAVGLGPEDVGPYITGLEGKVAIAAVNSPNSVTLSGDSDVVEGLAGELTTRGIFSRLLKTGGNAYHSHHMLPLGELYHGILTSGLGHVNDHGLADPSLRLSPPAAWISSVSPYKTVTKAAAAAAEQTAVGPTYWRANLESPVRFSEAISRMVTSETDPVDVLIEIGPHPALKSPISQILKSVNQTQPYLSSLQRGQNDQISMLHLAGALFGANAEIDLVAVNSVDRLEKNNAGLFDDSAFGSGPQLLYEHGRTAIDLPPYKYAYGPITYYESRFSREFRERGLVRHDLLGSKLPGNAKLRPQWRNILRLKDLAWLGDHKLLPDPVFPAAGYVAMAVEGASRAYIEKNTGSDSLPITGFSMRNVSINAALRIPSDDHGVEIITAMEIDASASPKSPAWMTFSISSVARETGAWNEHCKGQVKVELKKQSKTSSDHQMKSSTMDARAVDSRSWYNHFARIGLGYGPAFQGLSQIQADPSLNLAVASVALQTTKGTIQGGGGGGESRYPLHPASLDAVFQLGLIACHGGQTDKARTAFVPIHIDHLYLGNNASKSNTQDSAKAIARGELRGLRGAYAKLQMIDDTGNVVLDIPTLRCVAFTETNSHSGGTKFPTSTAALSSGKPFSSPYFRLAWKPDIRAMTNTQARRTLAPPPQENIDRVYLLDVFERLGTLMIAEIDAVYGDDPTVYETSTDIGHFLSWIRRRMAAAADDSKWVLEAETLSRSDRLALIHRLVDENAHCSDVRVARELFNNMDDILHGRKTGLDVVVPNGLLTAMYDDGIMMTGAFPQLARLFESIGHAEPSLRILEIGAGTGSATRIIMKALSGPNGIKKYKDYTFTDISSGFLTCARESFADCRDMNFSVLDIQNDPLQNGFESEYDLVIASECLHATACIADTLTNCRKLLKPGGRLVLVENIRTVIGHGLVLGTLTGYWSGINDGRVDSPFLTVEQWDEALKTAGFSGTDIVLDDYPDPYAIAATITSTAVAIQQQQATPSRSLGSLLLPLAEEAQKEKEKEVVLIRGKTTEPTLVKQLSEELSRRNIPWKSIYFDDIIPSLAPESRCIAFLSHDDEQELLLDDDAQYLELFQKLVSVASSLTLVTFSGMINGTNPEAAVAAGFLRTVATENPTSRYLFIDVDPSSSGYDSDSENIDLVRCLLQHESALQEKSTGETEDREFVWQDGCLWVSRLVPETRLADQVRQAEASPASATMLPFGRHGPVRAAFETPGLLTSLYFKPYDEMSAPLPEDWIQVEVAAVGLNWKDLAVSAGRFDMNSFSSEFSGQISAIGSAVSELKVGDRVYGSGRGHFGNFVRTPARFAQRMLPEDDFVELASMPLVYMTAVYAFEHATQVRNGDKVLIQSATGGLGLAAIRLARALGGGVEVYATVGTPDKVRYLVDEMGIPESHIFSSRDSADIPRMIEASGGKGFDVVLGTATGDMLYESLKAVAPLGRYIDVGRVDVQNSNSIGLELFQKSATFSSFDLGVVLDASPKTGETLMKQVDAHLRAGRIGPIPTISSSDVSRLDQVLLGFSKGTHIGKLVVTFTDPDALVKMVPPAPRARFLPNAQYVVTGGLGGLGRSIVNWMASRGARRFLVLSRSGGTGNAEAKALVERLAAKGVQVVIRRCDVRQRDDVLRMISEADAVCPIRGVLHAAVSYEDISFNKISPEKWSSGLAAKVHGTRHLHEATKSLPLDFFVATTSLESVLALATQSAYTAANNFQELFMRYRRRMGLPAATVSFGLVTDVGHLSTNTTTVNLMARNKALGVTEHQFLQLLEPAFLNNECGSSSSSQDHSASSSSSSSFSSSEDDPLSFATLITCMDPAAFAEQKRQQDESLSGGAAAATGGTIPKWYSDGRVCLVMRALEDALLHDSESSNNSSESPNGGSSSSSAISTLRQEFESAIKVGGAADKSKTETLVATAIVKTVAEMLFVDASGIDPSKTVAAYGVDSLIAAELRNWFNTAFGADISMLDLLDTKNSMRTLASSVVQGALTGTA